MSVLQYNYGYYKYKKNLKIYDIAYQLTLT